MRLLQARAASHTCCTTARSNALTRLEARCRRSSSAQTAWTLAAPPSRQTIHGEWLHLCLSFAFMLIRACVLVGVAAVARNRWRAVGCR